MEAFVGEIRLVGFKFVPRGWLPCDGQLLPIRNPDYQPLFSLLGNTFGGDGKETFAVPDLRGRVPIHQGEGLGLTRRVYGSAGGAETVTLNVSQLPTHSHSLVASDTTGTTVIPTGNVLARPADNSPIYTANGDSTLAAKAIGEAGGDQPHENMPPFLTLNYIICYLGIFPPFQ